MSTTAGAFGVGLPFGENSMIMVLLSLKLYLNVTDRRTDRNDNTYYSALQS